ncbi:facilitated trehalose transporter Tret1-like [Leptopilina heterotoma]|uniref:facilitated trehalose transporter Tret1-like n=1 Tax=Leptopilina heterotoma TaxID=63436 RepID=UPI001CA8B0B3|nr:facilitated trehalose transporter Tret1-like [Leptopilina heterotoma]
MSNKPKTFFLLQYAAAITGCITVTGYGALISWSSPAIPYLESEESKIKITYNQSSWIASINLIGLSIGFFLNPFFVDRIGRKWTLIMLSAPQLISWLLIILAKNYISLYCARLIGGIAYGAGLCTMILYVVEVSNKNNRGIFLLLIRLSRGIGGTLTIILGAYLNYQQMNYILLLLPILFIIIFLFMPDSSYFIEINQKSDNKCSKTVKTLNPQTGDFENSKLDNDKIELPKTENKKLSNKNSFSEKISETRIWKLFSNPTNRKAMIIVISTGLLNILSGQTIIGVYGQQILSYKTTPMDPKKAMILWSLLNTLTCLVGINIIEKINRRTILIFSGIISTISLVIIGVYFQIEKSLYNFTYLGWIPIICLSINSIFLSSGASNLFSIYQGEMFSSDIKSIAVTVLHL